MNIGHVQLNGRETTEQLREIIRRAIQACPLDGKHLNPRCPFGMLASLSEPARNQYLSSLTHEAALHLLAMERLSRKT